MKGAKQLRNMIYNILENSDAVSGVTLKNSPNSSTLLLDRADGKGCMTFHTLFPGLILKFGGNAMAAGLSLEEALFEEFQQRFGELVT